MPHHVLAISGSPRRNGNTETLIAAALDGAREAGATTELVALRDVQIMPCVECNACFKLGACRVKSDAHHEVVEKMLAADRIVFGSPVFFMTVSAPAKLLMDRCQCLWARKYVLGLPAVDPPRDRRGLVIAVGGSRSKRMFDCIYWPMKHWLEVLDVQYAYNLFVNQVDARGDAQRHTVALAEANRLGRALVESNEPVGQKPVNVELFEGIPGDTRGDGVGARAAR